MIAKIILFWSLLALSGFAFALAVQMRVLVGVVLRRALAAEFGGESASPAYRKAVVEAVGSAPQSKEAQHLYETYPRPLSHMRLARRVSVLAPPVIALILLAGRFALGVI